MTVWLAKFAVRRRRGRRRQNLYYGWADDRIRSQWPSHGELQPHAHDPGWAEVHRASTSGDTCHGSNIA